MLRVITNHDIMCIEQSQRYNYLTTIPPCVAENPACWKPLHALPRNNANICQGGLILSVYTLHISSLFLFSLLLLLSSVALTIPYLVVDVQNSLSSVSLGRAL